MNKLLVSFLALFLLSAPAKAEECVPIEAVKTSIDMIATNVTSKTIIGDPVPRINEALEATVGSKNPHEYDMLMVNTLMYQGRPYMFIVYFKDNCAVTRIVLNENLVMVFMQHLTDRGISF